MTDSKAEIQQLKTIIVGLYNENKKLNLKVTGISYLVQQLEEKKDENNQLKEKVKRLERSVARAENRVAQLDQMKDRGKNQTVITPGVSKKIMDALVRENTKLRLTVDHFKDGNHTLSTEIGLYQAIEKLKTEKEILLENQKVLKHALVNSNSNGNNMLQQQILQINESEENFKRKFRIGEIWIQELLTKKEELEKTLLTVNDTLTDKIEEISSLKKELNKTNPSDNIKDILDTVYD